MDVDRKKENKRRQKKTWLHNTSEGDKQKGIIASLVSRSVATAPSQLRPAQAHKMAITK